MDTRWSRGGRADAGGFRQCLDHGEGGSGHLGLLRASDRKWTISTDGGYEPRWRADGREIYYLSEDRKLMTVPVSTGAAPFGVPRALFQTEVHAGVYMLRTHYVPNRAGTRFLVHTRSGDLVPVPITVVLNWTAESKK